MDLVTVKTFDNYFTASICLTKLQDAGYECYLKDDTTATMLPVISNAIGGIKLLAKDTEKDEVLKLIEQFDKEFLEAAKCPKCGKTNFSYIAKPGAKNFLTAILTSIFSSYAVAAEYVYQCGSCGYETERLPDDIDTDELMQ
ncbi:hypothetical protein ACQ33O_07885 [Ferruginibacter sp. SUN002]|uniref:hypothetical protein n=1 Tax=Ferruginibacter sp. SUN002 TaxID=2937789 RepID=UPI003D362A45